MKGALDILLGAPEFELVVAVVGSSARFHPELALTPLIDCAGAAKPLAAFVVPDAPQALARLSAAGVPCFRTPEACADAVAAALRRRVPVPAVVRKPAPPGGGRLLDELEAYALLDRLRLARAPRVALAATISPAPAPPLPYSVAAQPLGETAPQYGIRRGAAPHAARDTI